MQKQKNYSIKGIIIGLLGLSLVIIVHELGHFLACKLFSINTPIFSIGFDPKIIGFKINSTLFQIGALPLGGYVSIDPQQLAAAAYWKKMIIIFAGVAMNILFAFSIFFFMVLRSTAKPIPVIETVNAESPAHTSGLSAGDEVVACDNESIHKDVSTLFQKLATSPGKTISLTIKRNNEEIIVPVTLGSEHPLYGAEVGYLGVQLKTVAATRPSLQEVIRNVGFYISQLFKRMSLVMASIFKKEKNGIIGPIGIITGIGRSAEYGLEPFLFFIAIINLNLAFFNILPIPFFDGGKAAMYTLEALSGHFVPAQATSLIYLIFAILLIMLIIIITLGDLRGLRKK